VHLRLRGPGLTDCHHHARGAAAGDSGGTGGSVAGGGGGSSVDGSALPEGVGECLLVVPVEVEVVPAGSAFLSLPPSLSVSVSVSLAPSYVSLLLPLSLNLPISNYSLSSLLYRLVSPLSPPSSLHFHQRRPLPHRAPPPPPAPLNDKYSSDETDPSTH
jgi:hypothetical protein